VALLAPIANFVGVERRLPVRLPDRSLAPVSKLAMTRALIAVLAVLGTGCITRPGMNASCEWPSEMARSLDVGVQADARHLVEDAELAVELADRYSVQHHEPPGPCEARLFRAIAAGHSVPVGDAAGARQRIAERGLDLLVNVPMGTVFVLVSLKVTTWVRRRFTDEAVPATITLILASVVLSGIFIILGDLWSSSLLMIRVGNHHVGGRAADLPWRQHTTELFIVGVVLFLVVTMVRVGTADERQRPAGVHPS
jgi:hypothetical protein